MTAAPRWATAALVLADGTVFWGKGVGAAAPGGGRGLLQHLDDRLSGDPDRSRPMPGRSSPSPFPHIGNVGTNPEDIESVNAGRARLVLRGDITEPANWRAAKPLDDWLKSHNLPGICRRRHARSSRAASATAARPTAWSCMRRTASSTSPALRQTRAAWPGLDGMDLAIEVTTKQTYDWDETTLGAGQGLRQADKPRYHVVAVDYGAKRNILRCLANTGCKVTVVPATATAEDILRHKPDGVFLSNGPGDPAATGDYAVPAIQGVLDKGVPMFGICLGHQLLALALGGKTKKMERGHRGANQPVKDLTTGKVEITIAEPRLLRRSPNRCPRTSR